MTPSASRALAGYAFAASLCACAPVTSPVSAGPPREFAELESKLLDRAPLALQFQIEATGAVEAEIHGEFSFGNGRFWLQAMGTFEGEPLEIDLKSLA